MKLCRVTLLVVDGGCTEKWYIMYYSHMQTGGDIITQRIDTLDECIAQCTHDSQCLGASYEQQSRTCYVHSPNNIKSARNPLIKDPCCIHAR